MLTFKFQIVQIHNLVRIFKMANLKQLKAEIVQI